MTTPGPRADKWRVRCTSARHLVLDIPPHPLRAGAPVRPQSEQAVASSSLTVTVKERASPHVGAAPCARPWYVDPETEMAELSANVPTDDGSSTPAEVPSSPVVETSHAVETMGRFWPGYSSTEESSEVGRTRSWWGAHGNAEEGDKSSDENSDGGVEKSDAESDGTAEKSDAGSDTESDKSSDTESDPGYMRRSHHTVVQLALCAPLAYQLIKLLPFETVLFFDRVLSALVVGGALHLAGAGLGKIKDFDPRTLEHYLLLLGVTGLCKIQTHPVLYPAPLPAY